MSRHIDHWLLAEQGVCHYCGKTDLVFLEPFDQLDACKECWEQITYGDKDD